jgi:hypothetical protein
MKRIAVGLILGLAVAACGVASAKEVVIDFTGDTVVSNGLKQVNNSAGSDGVTTILKKGGKNVACTGGNDAGRYMYLATEGAFKDATNVWVTVEFFDEGLGGARLQFQSAAATDEYAIRPAQIWGHDTQQFQKITWHLVEPALAGGMDGGADIRLDDRAGDDADGPLCVAKVTISDTDPNFTTFPYAAKAPVIDGAVATDEWKGAHTVVLDSPHQDGVGGSPNWKDKTQFSGTYSFMYDETNLYVLGVVQDATPRLNTTDDGVNYWNGDGFELFISLNDDDVERTACEDGKDYHLFVGLGKTPGWAASPGAGSMDPIGNAVAITDRADGYTFELTLPWKRLLDTADMKPGQRVAWYMFANNSTVDPSSQQIALGPTGITGPSCNPHVWIRGVLGPKP